MDTAQKPSGTDVAGVIENRSGDNSTTPGDAGMALWRRSGFAIDILVALYAHEESKDASYSEGNTVCVHANGALLAVTEVFEIGQWLLLINSKTGQESVCQVRFVHESGTGMNHAGVEFAAASLKFWGDISPLRDWDAGEPEFPQDPLPAIAAPLKPLEGGPPREPEPSATATGLKDIVVGAAKVGTPASHAKTGSRRSARLPAQIPVAIRALEPGKEPSYVKGKAITININGALLAVSALPKIGQLLHLTNLKARKAMVCKVRSVRKNATGVNWVAIELATAAPEFWGVTFSHDVRDTGER
jgi:hypothetical protein